MISRRFTIFWLGNLVSVIGDQISLTAFPWLVLQMTGDPALVGYALAIAGLPRALLMLYGGAVTDRLSPRLVMIWSGAGRMVAVLITAALLYLDVMTVPLVMLMALIFGIVDAFYYPAANAIVPSLVDEKDLQRANALNQMLYQGALIFGPLIAAFVIAGSFMHEASGGDAITTNYAFYRAGLADAFALDALTFLISIITLLMITARSMKDEGEAEESTLEQVKKAFRFVADRPSMRLAFIGFALLELFFQSPVFVGLPALSAIRYEEGASAFAQMVSSYGFGALIGGAVAGSSKPLKDTLMVPLLFLFFGWSSLVFGAVILYDPLWWAMVAFFTAGITDGYIWVQFMTWIQRHTPDAMMGRVMSILTVLSVGLLPVAHAITGKLISINVEGVILSVSIAMVAICIIAAIHPDARRMTHDTPRAKA